MPLGRRLFVVLSAIFCLLSVVGAQTGRTTDKVIDQKTDQTIDLAAAERILGPQWEQHAREAGMIFSATVLGSGNAQGIDGRLINGEVASRIIDRTEGGPVKTVPLRFHVDQAIAGVQAGQVLSVFEWAGYEWASYGWSGTGSLNSPMHEGEHVLLFLYPRSRLGLTSPVGGAQGQIHLDATGTLCAGRPQERPPVTPPVTLDQLARAIRWARGE